jgi:hypothetical protein
VLVAFVAHLTNANPKKYEADSESNPWRRSARSHNNSVESYAGAASDRTQRLGLTTGYGNTGVYAGSGYGTGLSGYQPLKIDLGGVIIGALIGVGALLILPKIFHGAGGGYGNYRSADDTGISDMINRVDDFLAQQNIDSTSCLGKAICHYVRSSEYHMSVGTADQIEQTISTLAQNSIVDYLLDGTAIKEAIENGKNIDGRDCDVIYMACPLDRKAAIDMMRKFFPVPAAMGRNK